MDSTNLLQDIVVFPVTKRFHYNIYWPRGPKQPFVTLVALGNRKRNPDSSSNLSNYVFRKPAIACSLMSEYNIH